MLGAAHRLVRANHFVQGHNLARVTRRMLGGVKDKPESGRGEALPTNLARDKETGF